MVLKNDRTWILSQVPPGNSPEKSQKSDNAFFHVFEPIPNSSRMTNPKTLCAEILKSKENPKNDFPGSS